jgi:formamidopyrimidine-DNA glycosylase
MPEGPEIWALGYALNLMGIHAKIYGKHLWYNGLDYSFGLTGGIHISMGENRRYTIEHIPRGYIPGETRDSKSMDELISHHRFEFDYMSAGNLEIKNIVDKWMGYSRTIGGLLLDQQQMSGIGVAWGSEILNLAHISPLSKINKLDVNFKLALINAMIAIQKSIKNVYKSYIDKIHTDKGNQGLIEFVNEWYSNLYKIRTMNVYRKKGAVKVKTAGRNFYTLK